MPNNFRGRPMRWRWGSGFTNAADLPSVDNAIAYNEPREGSDFAMTASGVEDAWTVGTDEFLEADLRYIPREDSLTPYRTVGWNGAAGLGAAIKWGRDKNIIYVHPDARNLVVSPKMNADVDANGVVDDFTGNKSTITSTTTFSLDGTDGAQKVLVSGNATGSLATPVIFADVWGIMPGEVLTLSADGRHQLSVAGAYSYLSLNFYDATPTQLSASASASFANSGTYGRQSVTATAPAGTVKARVHYYLSIPNTGSLTAWVRNMQLERAAAYSGSFLDNPSYPAYLADPMKGAPELEQNMMRRQRVKLRSSTGTAWDGY